MRWNVVPLCKVVAHIPGERPVINDFSSPPPGNESLIEKMPNSVNASPVSYAITQRFGPHDEITRYQTRRVSQNAPIGTEPGPEMERDVFKRGILIILEFSSDLCARAQLNEAVIQGRSPYRVFRKLRESLVRINA
jgi:hypothetical protein